MLSKADLFFFLVGLCMLVSCGTQRRLARATQSAGALRYNISESSALLDSLHKQASLQNNSSFKDSVLAETIDNVIITLQRNLDKMSESVTAFDLLAQKKSNFKKSNFYAYTVQTVGKIDSLLLSREARDRVYQLLKEAVHARAFHEFDMGAFFEPGVYKISTASLHRVSGPFQPAIDSIIGMSNRYADIKRKVYLVFVGYADESSVNASRHLYTELSNLLPPGSQPSRQNLNLVLSQLRANELQRNMKLVIAPRIPAFKNSPTLDIGYFSYGRGEALPFKNLTDYRVQDERRRVVVFYWSVLPVVN